MLNSNDYIVYNKLNTLTNIYLDNDNIYNLIRPAYLSNKNTVVFKITQRNTVETLDVIGILPDLELQINVNRYDSDEIDSISSDIIELFDDVEDNNIIHSEIGLYTSFYNELLSQYQTTILIYMTMRVGLIKSGSFSSAFNESYDVVEYD